MPTLSTIYDKPGAGWNRIDPDNYFTSYFKTNITGDVVQQEKSITPHQFEEDHIHLMDITLILTSSLMRSRRVFVSLVTGNSTKNCFVF